jgi:hypothetical protein
MAAMRGLHAALSLAKRNWANQRLHHAADAKDIWRLASVRKGRRTNIFPALRDADGNWVDEPAAKARLLRDRFFPSTCPPVDPIQPDNPPTTPARRWESISEDEIKQALATTSASSAPGLSGTGYTLLKWVHAARPDLLTELFNLSIDAGTHPWKTATVVAINKPNKPDYSQPKAYRPISLLECTGKVLEKIVAKRFNRDIAQHNLLPMTQFGSWAQHCATDAVATLVHRIQAT